MKLKSKEFTGSLKKTAREKLCEFANENKIKIISITGSGTYNNYATLYYYE